MLGRVEISPELQQVASTLATQLVQNTASMVVDRVRASKAANKAEDTIAQLEQIVAELVADKNAIIRVAQAYQAELVAQRLTPGDVKYIPDTVVPLIEKLLVSGDDAETSAQLEMLKPLLSAETVNVLQILGFNFREAIGKPLTELVAQLILARSPGRGLDPAELRALELRREIAYLEVYTDEDAFNRMRS